MRILIPALAVLLAVVWLVASHAQVSGPDAGTSTTCGVSGINLQTGTCLNSVGSGGTSGGRGGGGTPSDNPAASLNFTSSAASGCSTITSCLTVTRAQQETCIDASGNITYASANTACITSAGIYITGGGTNVNTQSQTFSTATATNATLTPSNVTAPDGTVNGAATLTDNVTNNVHRLVPAGTLTPSAGQLVTFSVFVAPGTCAGAQFVCHYVQLNTGFHDNPANTAIGAIAFYLDNFGGATPCAPAIPNSSTTTPPIIDYGGQVIANGYCRIWITLRSSDTTASTGVIQMIQSPLNNRSPNFAGAGSSILLWGAQTNAGTIIPYIPTTATSATLAADNIVFASTAKTTLEGAAGRAVFTSGTLNPSIGTNGGFVQATMLGVGTTTMGLGRGLGNIAQTAWGSGTIKTNNQAERNAIPPVFTQQNSFGMSWSGAGRCIAINAGTNVCDSNAPSAVVSEQLGALSDQSLACECYIQSIKLWNTRNDSNMNTATAVSGTPAQLASYTGAVATRTQVMASLSTTLLQLQARSRHRITENVACIQVTYANFYMGINASPPGQVGIESAPGAANTITLGLEYPVGTFTQATWSASTSGTLPNGGILTSDPICPTGGIVAWDYFFLRPYVTSSTGLAYITGVVGIEDTLNGEAMTIAASGVLDQSLGGTITNTAANQIYAPLAITGTTYRPSVCVVGDSINAGVDQGSTMDGEGMLGIGPTTIGRRFGYNSMAAGGDRVALFLSNNTNRIQLAPWCTTVYTDYGINDLIAGAASPSTVQTNLQSLWQLAQFSGKTIWQSTITNDTTSTDGFATTANQTLVSGASNVPTVNSFIVGSPAGLTNAFDVSGVVSSSPGSGLWKAPGIANWCTGTTGAGLHPNQSCTSLIRSTQTIDLTKIH